MGLFTKKNIEKQTEAINQSKEDRAKECSEEIAKILAKHNCQIQIIVKTK